MTYRHRKPKTVSQEEYDNDFRKWKDDRCPICKLERETPQHILSCTSRRCVHFRIETNTSLPEWFTQQHTGPFISQSILLVLFHDGTLSFEDSMRRFTNEELYIQAARSQDYINYDHFQFGRMSKYFIYQLYRRMRSIWKKRCKIVHVSTGRKISRRVEYI